MALPRVAAFTDTYLPTVNGVTYTVSTWREHWERAGGHMDVIYPESTYDPAPGEHAVPSVPLPFYDGFRLGSPAVPNQTGKTDIVHAHTPFGLGFAGYRFARKQDLPFIVSYHTPTAEYAGYLSKNDVLERGIRRLAARYERWFLERADHVVVPSQHVATHLDGVSTRDISVVSNGVDTDQFEPDPAGARRLRQRLDCADDLLVGYTGRHGHEKEISVAIDAVAGLEQDVTLVLSGDGPARTNLEEQASSAGVDVRFLGFLDREWLPAFYSLLDLFVFPSPVETQGLVALESMACGTPVIGADSGALAETITCRETGYTAPASDSVAFRAAIERGIQEQDRLAKQCLSRREEHAVSNSIETLSRVYERASEKRNRRG